MLKLRFLRLFAGKKGVGLDERRVDGVKMPDSPSNISGRTCGCRSIL
jgi:hypothetical protein